MNRQLNRIILKLMDLLAIIPVPPWIRKRNYRSNVAMLESVNTSSARVPGQSSSSALRNTIAAAGTDASLTWQQEGTDFINPQFAAQNDQQSTASDPHAKPFLNQHSPLWQSARFGRFHMDYNGCGEIAVINLLHRLGGCSTPVQEAEVIAAFERHGAVLMGLFGTSPLALIRFLEKQEVAGKVCIAPDRKTLESLWTEYDLFLITAWNDPKKRLRGMHTFTAEKKTSSQNIHGSFVSYNASFRHWPEDVIIATGFKKDTGRRSGNNRLRDYSRAGAAEKRSTGYKI